MKRGTYNIYKSKGAAQFTLGLPTYTDGRLMREGCIFIEVAPGNGDKENPVWDWQKKMNFALGMNDIAGLLDTTNANIRFVHDNKGIIKTLQFKPGTGEKFEGTWMMSLNQGGKEGQTVMVPISNGEWNILMILIRAAIPHFINWNGLNEISNSDPG